MNFKLSDQEVRPVRVALDRCVDVSSEVVLEGRLAFEHVDSAIGILCVIKDEVLVEETFDTCENGRICRHEFVELLWCCFGREVDYQDVH